ncbi:MAG: flagellar biosynthesis protein FlhB [Eubacteriales bacterium]
MADSGKTEKATPKKREDERKKGNIYFSRDIANSLSFVVVMFLFKLFMSPAVEYLKAGLSGRIAGIASYSSLGTATARTIFIKVIIDAFLLIIPIGLAAALTVITFTGLQTRFLFSPSRLKPKFSRLNPAEGLKKMVSLKSFIELMKSVIKLTIIAAVVYGKIKLAAKAMLALPFQTLSPAMAIIGGTIYDIAISISIYMALFSTADYLYQWWEYEKNIMMTKQEIKEEYKQTEGDPHIKGRIKDVQRKMASLRMMKKVKTSDVVIRNPTHYAVALKYKPPKDKAPIVVAKGRDLVALKIIDIAKENSVHITENRPLARGIYESVELDRPIPEEFYKAVAEILAFIFKLNKEKSKGGGSK